MLPFTIVRKHPIVPSKLKVAQQEEEQEQQQKEQQELQAVPTMAPHTPEDPGETNFNGEEEEYPETTSLITPTTTPTLLSTDSPTWRAPSPPTLTTRTSLRRDSVASDSGGDVERGNSSNASGRKIIR